MAILTEEEKKRRVALPTFDSPQSAAAALAGMQATARAQMAGQGALAPTQPAQAAAPGVRQDLGLTTFTSQQDAANALASMRTRARSQMAAQGALPSAAPAASPSPTPTGPTWTSDLVDNTRADASKAWSEGNAGGVGRAIGIGLRGAALAVPAGLYDAGDAVVNGPIGRGVGGFVSGLLGGPGDAAQPPAVAVQASTQNPAPAKFSPAKDSASVQVQDQTAALASGKPPQLLAGPQTAPTTTADGSTLTAKAGGTIQYDPVTKTYSGTDVGPNATIVNGRQRGSYVGVGGNDAPGFGMPGANGISSGAASAQRAADIYKSMAYGDPQQGVSVPTVLHSGNDWQSRNNLRNLEISASSMTNQPNAPGRRGQSAGESPAVTAYKQALATDAALQGAAPGLASQTMQQNSAITQTGMREAGANQRSDAEIAARTGTDMARLGLDARRFNETAATGAMERARMGLGMQSLQQEQALRDTLLDPKATPEQRKQAQSSLLALQGKTENPNRFTVVPGGQQVDQVSGKAFTVPSRVLDNQTGRFIDQPDAARAADLPAGMKRQVGTSSGRPVYEDEKGNRFVG